MNLSEEKNRQTLGKLGESLAARYLQKRGFSIIERNFRAGHGEIDIIARDHGILVFVEVKTRTSDVFGLPEEAVTPKKLREIIKTAAWYTLHHHMQKMAQRIDVIAIQLYANAVMQDIRHIQNVSG